MHISNGIIAEITERMGEAFFTVEYGRGEVVRLLVEEVTIGRIWNIDRNNRRFDTITGQDFSSLTRFNVPENARILNRQGRTMNFSGLMIGMRVQVRHANFMTPSIPPQTTAFEVRVL